MHRPTPEYTGGRGKREAGAKDEPRSQRSARLRELHCGSTAKNVSARYLSVTPFPITIPPASRSLMIQEMHMEEVDVSLLANYF